MHLKHYCGPRKPIHKIAGLKVLDPFEPYEERISQTEAILLILGRATDSSEAFRI